MATPVQNLIARGAAAMLQQMGTSATLSRNGQAYWTGSLVWVETSSAYSVELGGSLYTVTGRATVIAAALPQAPIPGDRLAVDGHLCIIVGAFKSPYDATWNLEASTLK